jgi:antitoxin HigA-1
MEMYDPPHPGEILKETCLAPLGVSVTKAAKALGVTRETLSRLINGKTGVSPEMAIRLSKAFDTTPELWLGMQQQYDLWQLKSRADEIEVSLLTETTLAT